MMHSTKIPKAIEDALETCSGTTSRRDFLKTSGVFVLSVSGATLANTGESDSGVGSPAPVASTAAPYLDPDFRALDSWIAVHEDGTATFYVGKTDGGQGTGTAFLQLMCDELDIAFEKATLVMGRTDITVDQGGSGGSDAIERDAWAARRVAAEARRVLLEMASERFGVPVDGLAVSDGEISIQRAPSMKVTYGELVGGRRFNVTLTGENINATTGVARVKSVQDLKLVGQPLPRYDIPAKVDGSLEWAVDVRLPGMVHARNVRPPVAGASLIGIDESSVSNLPGFIQVVSRGNYIAVVCEREEQAIEAARLLEVEWEKPCDGALPLVRGPLQLPAQHGTDVPHSNPGRAHRSPGPCGGQPRRSVGDGRDGRRSGVRLPVPGTHGDRSGPRAGRSVGRPDDDLLQRHEAVQPPDRRR